jgi:hypothetical protein
MDKATVHVCGYGRVNMLGIVLFLFLFFYDIVCGEMIMLVIFLLTFVLMLIFVEVTWWKENVKEETLVHVIFVGSDSS